MLNWAAYLVISKVCSQVKDKENIQMVNSYVQLTMSLALAVHEAMLA